MPVADADQPIESCAGCGAVLAPLPGEFPTHPGASAACARLFEVTLRGLREEATADAAAATSVGLADAAYDAQHPVAGDPDRLRTARSRLGVFRVTQSAARSDDEPPRVWRSTIADVAADLDVIDLPVLVESWARSVEEDWTADTRARP
ncbi:MAG: DUF5946 family protein [Blastococcus sp.]